MNVARRPLSATQQSNASDRVPPVSVSIRILRWALPLIFLGAAISVVALLFATRPTLVPVEPEEQVWSVTAIAALAQDIQPEMRVFGEIVPGREVELRPLVAGRVVDVGENFRNGGIVANDEFLVAIDPFDYEAAVAETNAQIVEFEAKVEEIRAEIESQKFMLETDREQLALRNTELERQQTLAAKGSGSRKSVDEALIAFNQQRQQLSTSRRTLATLRTREAQQEAALARLRVALGRAERDLAETQLRAPFDGFIFDINTAIGKFVGTGDRVATLFDANNLEARFHLSDAQYARLLDAGGAIGREAQVVWWLAETPFIHDSVIGRVESQIDSASGGVDLYATLSNTGPETRLRPGAFVEIRVPDRVYKDVYDLPEAALFESNSVFVLGPDDRLEQHKAEIVYRDRDRVLIRGDIEGRRVVTSLFDEIGPGVLVREIE